MRCRARRATPVLTTKPEKICINGFGAIYATACTQIAREGHALQLKNQMANDCSAPLLHLTPHYRPNLCTQNLRYTR